MDEIVVITTCDDRGVAERIASSLVEKRLAACVNMVDSVASVYRWKEGVEKAREILLLAKTNREQFPGVQAEIERLHSYELPEVIALPVIAASDRYLDWLREGIGRPSAPGR